MQLISSGGDLCRRKSPGNRAYRLDEIPTEVLAEALAARTLQRDPGSRPSRTLTLGKSGARFSVDDYVRKAGVTIRHSHDPRDAFAALIERLVIAWTPGADLEVRIGRAG